MLVYQIIIFQNMKQIKNKYISIVNKIIKLIKNK